MAGCPACGKELPGEFPFCPFCAAPLTGPGAAAEERKVVSVLFCDLVGFTAASETADPEDVRARLRPYHARLREEIERFGGTVEKFVGDAVMAVFGAPVAHEDDAERAVRAGLRILEAISELNDAGAGLEVRIGVNTGEAVVALGARPELGEGIVTGDVVNTASRIQGVAPVNAVAVSEQTHRATKRAFDYEPLEPVTVKGKAEPLALYRPLRARADLGREVTRSHTTPLVGRDLERSLLIGTFDRATKQRSCQLVTLVGEPGVGKSRLCMELARHVDAQPALFRWRQGRCLPYGDGIAFWALGEIVKAECGILESDSPETAEAKLEAALPNDGGPDRSWLKSRLAPLVGVPGEPGSQQESFAAWRQVLESWAAGRETVLVFEDLHWADDSLLSFLEHLADWAEGVPLLVLCTARPELFERNPTFGANARNAQRINLSPLTDEETARLIASLLERTLLPDVTQEALLERSGGNPLYAEEFVRLLADHGLGESVEVPESVQALIAARLDTLSPQRKSLLQDAAVVGKVFWTGALAEMGGLEHRDVEVALHELARKELVRPFRTSSMDGEAEYGFWHLLVRDVCYQQVPRAGRAARHQAAAVWLEAKAGDRVEDLSDVLAHHYEAALELSRAAGLDGQREHLQGQVLRYLTLAGERALSLDVELAERQLARALELCPPGAGERAWLLERLAYAVQLQGRLHDARRPLEQAVDLYRDRGDPVALGRALGRLANVAHRLGDPVCEEMLVEAVEVLEAQPRGPELVAAYTWAAGRRLFTDDDAEAIVGAERAIALAADLGLPEPAFALHVRGVARAHLGDADGIEDLRRARGLALEQGLGRETAVIFGNLAGAIFIFQGVQAGLDASREAIAFSERRGLTEMVLQNSSVIPLFLAWLGRTEEALAEVGPLAERLEEGGDMSWVFLRAEQLRLLTETGDSEDAPEYEPLVAAAREIHLPVTLAATFDAAAAFLLEQGRREQAHALLTELDESHDLGASVVQYELPRLSRTALALGDLPLAQRLVASLAPRTPPADNGLASARAQLAEAGGDHLGAAASYADAARRWREFGNVPERAYALLGQGRCLVALEDAGAEVPLSEARELFASMGYKPALAEVEELLSRG